MKHPCSKCGRPALMFPKWGKNRSRRARSGQPYAIKGHDLCQECFESVSDSNRSEGLKMLENEPQPIDWQTLPRQLQALREDCKYSQRQAAEIAGVSREWIAGVENGSWQPSIKALCKYVAALGRCLMLGKAS